ncbi:MAG: hypothetical protein C4331_03240 [Meiothermus sp.]
MGFDIHALLESMAGPAWLADPTGRVAYANTAARAYSVYPPVHPEEAGVLEQGWKQVMHSGAPLSLTLRLGQGQEYRRFDCRLALLEPLCLFTCTEVETQLRVNEALQERCERLEILVGGAPLGVAQLDSQLRYLEVNEALARFNGLRREDHPGRSLAEVIGPNAEPVVALCHQVLRTGEPVLQRQLEFETPAGRSYWEVSLYPIRGGAGVTGLGLEAQDVTEREVAAQELRRSEKLLQDSIDSLTSHIAILDGAGTILKVNAGWQKFAGLNRFLDHNYGIGSNYLEACLPGDKEPDECDPYGLEAAQGIRAVIEGEQETFEMEYPCHAPEELRWFVMRVTRFESADGLRVVVAHDNVTERKLTELALRESGRRLRFTLEAARLGDWELELSTRKATRSLLHDQIFGYPEGAGEWSLERFLEHVLPEDRARVEQSFEEAVAQQQDWSFECRIRRADGVVRWIWARGSHIYSDSGEPSSLAGLVQDITERKRAEERLRASEEQFRRTVEEAPIPIIMQAEDGEVLQISRTWTELTGYSLSDIPTFNAWLSRAHSSGVDAVRKRIYTLFQGNVGIAEVEFEIVTWSGDVRTWALSASSPGFLSDGRRFVVGMAVDITERKRAEDALRESERRYRELAEAQKRFVSDASHELRAPLTAIQGNLELLQRFQMNPADREAALEEAAREAARLGRLVGDMLALARGDAGSKLKKEPVALKEVLLEAFGDYQRRSKNHRFELGVLEEAQVQGERDRLKQLAVILLDNAVKYTPAGGRIRLELTRNKKLAVFRIQDTGVGIAPEHVPHVFERFYRVDESRNQRSGGSGLGLSIAQWIVGQHGGDIRLESGLEVGTTVTVSLPLQKG